MEVFLHFPFTAMILKEFTKASRLHGRQNNAVCQLCQYEELYDNSLMATPAPALAWPAIVVLSPEGGTSDILVIPTQF